MEAEKPFAKKCEEYAEAQGLRDMMQSLLKLLLQHQPEDPLQYLIDHLKQQQLLEAQEFQPQLQQPQQEEEQQQQQVQQQQLSLPLRLVMLGLPGSGRREVSARLAERWGLPLVSVGSLLRAHAEKYPRGEAAKALSSKTLGAGKQP
ncbi:uncharacterized protein EMH_0091980 [Eimeria mitis]|uniref:Adenylate kinase n=1 Tax=Eimeria mitis TaxID=44415 RepID=U6KIJ0_9EIME|nr:uncharacterized protein EMH_0091980 [Eimeria mitis]CDJ36616.1 hypothetical protein EMH_0091980 [Eimeria mitis]